MKKTKIMKTELEEAAKFNYDNKTSRIPVPTSHWINSEFLQIQNFIEGAKWQAERMYSEEDMIEFAEFVATYPDKNKNINGQILHAKSKYDGSERTVDLLEQFKKKA